MKSVSLMDIRFEHQAQYTETPRFQVLQFPYQDRELSMFIFLPRDADGLKALEEELDYTLFQDCLKKMRAPKELLVRLPRFKADTRYSLAELVASLGLKTAFSDDADFSGMTKEAALKIGYIIHKAVKRN